MIEYIRGKLVEATQETAILELNGIGYSLFIPLNNYSKLPHIGKDALLYVSTVIREDAHKHFGFLTKLERDLFEKLIDISGIGPKTALALVGHMEIADLQLAISQGNTALLSKIPGVGKKTAERLVIELKDKFKKWGEGELSATTFAVKDTEKGIFSDAMSALVNLGYPPLQAQKAVKTVLEKSKEPPELAKLITAALRAM